MIKNFKCKETEKVYKRQYSKKLPRDIQEKAYRKLKVINNISDPEELRFPPSNNLKKLTGDRKGQWRVWINDQWRICFNFDDGDAHNVEIVDYH